VNPTTLFPIEALLVLRFLKHVAVLALAAGTIGAFVPEALAERRRFAFGLAGPGLGTTWTLGLVLAFGSSVSFLAPWIVGAIAASMISINVVLWSVGKEGRRSPIAAAIACAGIVVSVALMVWKPVLSSD
jgi:hypothetical protein